MIYDPRPSRIHDDDSPVPFLAHSTDGCTISGLASLGRSDPVGAGYLRGIGKLEVLPIQPRAGAERVRRPRRRQSLDVA